MYAYTAIDILKYEVYIYIYIQRNLYDISVCNNNKKFCN